MPARDPQKQIKIFYLDPQLKWQPYAQAALHLDILPNTCTLRITLQHQLEPDLLPILPLTPLLQLQENTIQIELQRISKIERLDDLIISIQIQQWNRVLSFSFRDEEYCDVISEQIELNTSSRNKLPCREDQLIDYVAEQIENNPFFVEVFFNSEDLISAFVKQAQKYQSEPDSLHKRTVFRTVKLLLLRADKSILKILLKQQYYEQVLMCFSFNYQFGDRIIYYHQEYRKSTNCSNVLGITDPTILEKYQEIIKINHLYVPRTPSRNCPLISTEILIHILNQNSLALLTFFGNNSCHLAQANKLAETDPEAFIQLFSQLWEMFKSVMEDINSAAAKRSFRESFVKENTINVSLSTIKKLTEQGKGTGRLYQQFLEAFNPFLSHNWNESQELLLFHYQQGHPHILELLLSILKIADYNTKAIVLLFAKNLVESTENRPKIKQSFFNYFFNQFVSPCVNHFTSTEELQILVEFYMKLYKIDLIRTRRSIIESELLQKLQEATNNKYILMLVLKLLRFFMESSNQGIFQYLARRNLFTQIRLKYFEVKKYSPSGIIYSLFLGLLKDARKTDNVAGVKYIHNLMFPDEKVQ